MFPVILSLLVGLAINVAEAAEVKAVVGDYQMTIAKAGKKKISPKKAAKKPTRSKIKEVKKVKRVDQQKALEEQVAALKTANADALAKADAAKRAEDTAKAEAVIAQKAADQARKDAADAQAEKDRQAAELTKANADKAKAEAEAAAHKVVYHKPSVEFGVLVGNSNSVSSSPISSVGFTANTGYMVSVSGQTPVKNVDWVASYAWQSYNISLAGVDLGSIPSTTISVGGRYNFTTKYEERLVPFVGAGIYSTSFGGQTLLNNTLKVGSTGLAGVSIEAGVRTTLKKHFSASITVEQHFGSTGYNRLETNAGSAQLTMYNVSNPRSIHLGVGYHFD